MVTLRDAKEASDSIVRAFKPVSIVVFGSVARDMAGTDLDLLIVTEDGNMSANGVIKWPIITTLS
jgi:predicted nucleotidyltransferase